MRTCVAVQVGKLCRAEWAAIRTVMGRPRRLSSTFLREERGKLERYRQDVRLVQQGRVRHAVLAGARRTPQAVWAHSHHCM